MLEGSYYNKLDKMDFKKPIDEEDGWKLLEERTVNNRAIIAWYNPNDNIISVIVTHVSDQPNSLSIRSPYTTWGYVTHMVSGMYSVEEASEVVGLYLQDMEKGNFWWEND